MEFIEYKGCKIYPSDYSYIVTYDGVIMGQFDTEEDAREYIDAVDERTDPEDFTEYSRQPTVSEFEDYTGLQLTMYDGNVYIETTGKDYDEVYDIIRDYNEGHGSFISCYYDKNKDAVFIKL